MEQSTKTRNPEIDRYFAVMARLICFFIGHKKAVPMLYEDNHSIHTKGCPRCKTPTMFPTTWKGCPNPPNSNPEQIEKFNKWKENHYAEVRASVNGQQR